MKVLLLISALLLGSCKYPEPNNVHIGMSYEKFLTRCNVSIPERTSHEVKTVETQGSKTTTLKLGSKPFWYGDPPANNEREPECADATFTFVNDKLTTIER